MPRSKHWTVLVYMGADGDDAAEMARFAFGDVDEMRTVQSSDHMNIAVQLDLRLFPPVRFQVRSDGTFEDRGPSLGLLRESSTGRPRTLEKFLEWARIDAPADHYLLVLWGHGLGIGHSVEEAGPLSQADVAYDADDGLDVRELAGVLRRFKERNNNRPVDVLGFDACYMCATELAHELSDTVSFIVGSQIPIPLEGWPYDAALKRLRRHPRMSPVALSADLVDAFIRSYPKERALTQTVLQPAAAPEVTEAMRTLVAAVNDATRDSKEVRRIGRAFARAKFVGSRQFVDLRDLCRLLASHCHDADVKQAARAVGDALAPGPARLIVRHRRRGRDAGQLNGVSIYVNWLKAKRPVFDVDLELPEYKRLKFVKRTKWQKLNTRLKRLKTRGRM